MADNNKTVEVVYAECDTQWCIQVSLVAEIQTVEDAITASQVLMHAPQLDKNTLSLGIWGKRADLADPVHAGDRIEIYRPLQIDPLEARRLRVEKKRRSRGAA